MDMEHERRLTEVEERSKANSHRIDKLEKNTESINRLATAMAVMAEKQDETNKAVTALDEKVTVLEEKPAKRWESLAEKVIWAIVSIVIGYLAARLGLG